MTKQNEIAEPQKELAVAKETVQKMRTMVESSKITNEQELAAVSDKIKNIKTLAKGIKEKRDLLVSPAKKIIEEAKLMFDPLIKECENQELILKDRAGKYMMAVEQKRKEDEAKIAARVEKGTLKQETAIAKLEALPEAPKTVRTDTGSGIRMSKRKVAFVSDPSLVPDEFWIIDDIRVRREALERDRYGKDPIPGVSIKEETSVASV